MSGRARLGAVILAAVLSLLALASPAAAADPTVGYTCDPPLPPAVANCAAWHTGPVNLTWNWDAGSEPAAVLGSDCASPHVIDKDTAGLSVMCAVWDIASNHKVAKDTATIRLDATPPSVTGMTPARPPDHDGWWNHPVSVVFAGTDATSGIASCDTVDYAGPDGEAAQVTGACRDVAGNSAARAFGLQYDATPPTLTPFTPEVGDSHVALSWTTSPDAVLTEIIRSPGIGGAPASKVYSGPDKTFSDPAVINNTTYTYSISSSDAAANAASTVVVVTPKAGAPGVAGPPGEAGPPGAAGPPGPPLAQGIVDRLPRLRWRRVSGADYYNVQLFHGRTKILSSWPRGTDLQLRRQWTFRGRRHVLTAGHYHWYAWPGYGRRSAHRYGRLIAHRKFTFAPKTP